MSDAMQDAGIVLAVQPDPTQIDFLESALGERFRGNVVFVDSTDAALSAIDEAVPDLVLLHPLMTPGEEEYLLGYLRTLSETAHVQAISIPHEVAPFPPTPASQKRRLFGWLKGRPSHTESPGCAPDAFAADVTAYLARAREMREERLEQRREQPKTARDRREDPRWARSDVACVTSVHFTSGERADLINLSVHGALVRTDTRPALLSVRPDSTAFGRRPGLTLIMTSGEEIRATGKIIRCDVRRAETGAKVYDVAFRFDDAVRLDLTRELASTR